MTSGPADRDPLTSIYLRQARRKARLSWLIPLAALPLFDAVATAIPGWLLLVLIIATPIAGAIIGFKAVMHGRSLPDRSLIVHGSLGLVLSAGFALLMIMGFLATS